MNARIIKTALSALVKIFLAHNNPCFKCNIAIRNFLVTYTYEIRFNDVIDKALYQ